VRWNAGGLEKLVVLQEGKNGMESGTERWCEEFNFGKRVVAEWAMEEGVLW